MLRRSTTAGATSGAVRPRQADHEAAAPARLALRGDRAAVRRGDAPGDGQAQPDPRAAEPAGRLGAIERARRRAGGPRPGCRSRGPLPQARRHRARARRGRRSACPVRCTCTRFRAGCPATGRAAAGAPGSRAGPRRSPRSAGRPPARGRTRCGGGRRPRRPGRGVPGRAARPRRRPGRGTAAPRRPARAGRRRRGAGPGQRSCSSTVRGRRRATSIAAIRAASGVRSWCDAWPVNCLCRSSATCRRSRSPLKLRAKSSSSSRVPGLGSRPSSKGMVRADSAMRVSGARARRAK